MFNIINKEEVTQNTINLWDKIFTHGENITTIILNFFVVIIGLCGARYLYKLKEKRLNATFTYYSRLKVRLQILSFILQENKDEILDRFIPVNNRHEAELNRSGIIRDSIEELVSTANDTILFLKTEEEQMPASIDWSEHYCTLLELLYDCRHIGNENYFKWSSDYKMKQEKYYETHLKNLEYMQEKISERQIDLEEKMFKESIFKRLYNKLNVWVTKQRSK